VPIGGAEGGGDEGDGRVGSAVTALHGTRRGVDSPTRWRFLDTLQCVAALPDPRRLLASDGFNSFRSSHLIATMELSPYRWHAS